MYLIILCVGDTALFFVYTVGKFCRFRGKTCKFSQKASPAYFRLVLVEHTELLQLVTANQSHETKLEVTIAISFVRNQGFDASFQILRCFTNQNCKIKKRFIENWFHSCLTNVKFYRRFASWKNISFMGERWCPARPNTIRCRKVGKAPQRKS